MALNSLTRVFWIMWYSINQRAGIYITTIGSSMIWPLFELIQYLIEANNLIMFNKYQIETKALRVYTGFF